MARIFLLSPANCGGRRARQLLAPTAGSSMAAALRSDQGAALGDVFAFVSALYFRGKLTYARRFAQAPEAGNPVVGSGVHIITPNAGLREPDTLLTSTALRAFSAAEVHENNAAYRRPLERSARSLADEAGDDCDVVLLGSIASPKYTNVLLEIFGNRLLFPVDFVGRGDMSRGGLLLRKAAEGCELEYAAVAGATVHGVRPAKLPRLVRSTAAPPHLAR